MAHFCQKEYLIESTLKGPICLPVSDGLSSEGNLLIFLDRKRVTSKAEATLNILQDSRKGNDESAEGEKAAALPPGTSIPQESSARLFRFYPSITQSSPATQNSIWAIYLHNLTQENTIPFEHWSRADSPAMETRRAAGTRAGRCRAGQSEPFDQLAARTNTAEVLTSRPARLSKP
ncbi:unnamed protein product [Nesidiocoris tenuis]|uniref:Uncharacterized protein n=1 Tax=Nesidiocoris tenuis TaxID=355587 RepID=A0A6H5GGZ2_9HEMI|nr:unnamed protein product [Nesidiocoris tenuis]